jgi:LysM repeat protein
VVQPGETLSEIAKAYGVSVSVIIRENNLQKPDQLRVGQKLFIPE